MPSIPMLIMSALSTCETHDEAQRADAVASRLGEREAPLEALKPAVDVINAADLTQRALRLRARGHVQEARLCEDARDGILARYGF